MGRLSELRTHMNCELEMIPDPKTRTGAAAHLCGVSLAATMLAKKRGLDSELASLAAMLHDLWAYKNGSYEDHAHRGAALALEIAKEIASEYLTEYEVVMGTHVDKDHIHSHLILNSVNGQSGKKRHVTTKEYYSQIRAVSDRRSSRPVSVSLNRSIEFGFVFMPL